MSKCHSVLGLVLGLGCWVLPQAAQAEILPTSGTFDGYYHRDRLGVGHFLFFYVAPDLHEKLAKYEGKFIRLVVTKAEQPMNPGDAIIMAIGQIQELPQPPLKFTVKTRPNPVVAGQPFQLILEISDIRQPEPNGNPAGLSPEAIRVNLRQPSADPGPDPDKASFWFRGYTTRQLAVDVDGRVEWRGDSYGHNLWTSRGALEFRPGDSWVWVVSFPAGVARTDGEVHVMTTYLIADEVPGEHGRTVTPIEAWQDVPVRPPTATRPPAAPDDGILRLGDVKITPTGEDGWSNLQFTLLPAAGKKVRVPGDVNGLDGKVYPHRYASIGCLEAFQADGTPVELQVRRVPETDLPSTTRARFVNLPETGAVITARYRKDSRFAPDIARLIVRFVTEAGVDTLTVSDNYRDPYVTPATPFGSATDGVKIRVRPAKTTFKAGAALTFYMQAVNTSGKPICWWRPYRGYGDNVIVEIDGKPVQLPEEKAEFIGGWAGEWTTKNPTDWTVTLPETISLAKGRHTLRYTITSKGGTYMNANQQPIPLVNGKVVSNEAAFSIE